MADTKTQYLEEPLMKEDKRKCGVAQLQYRRPTELMLYCISLSPFACQIPDLPIPISARLHHQHLPQVILLFANAAYAC